MKGLIVLVNAISMLIERSGIFREKRIDWARVVVLLVFLLLFWMIALSGVDLSVVSQIFDFSKDALSEVSE